MKSLLFMQNTPSQAIAVNTPLNLGRISRRYGKNIKLEGENAITVIGAGYYIIDVAATLTATAAGLGSLVILVNGQPLATQSALLANTESQSLSIPAAIRVYCYAPVTTIQIVTDGVAAPEISNLQVRVMEG